MLKINFNTSIQPTFQAKVPITSAKLDAQKRAKYIKELFEKTKPNKESMEMTQELEKPLLQVSATGKKIFESCRKLAEQKEKLKGLK